MTEEECARMCVQSKHCNCKSFAHNAQKGRCLIANRCGFQSTGLRIGL